MNESTGTFTTVRVSQEVYDLILAVKHQLEIIAGNNVSMSDTLNWVLKEQGAKDEQQ